DYLRLVRRVVVHRWRIIVAGFLVVVVPTVALVTLSTENLYEASVTLFLLPEKNDPPFLREFTSPEATAVYIVLLKSRSLAQAITYVDVRLSRSSSFARQQARGTRELLENLMIQARSSQGEAEDAMRRFQAKAGGRFTLPDESKGELTALAQIESQIGDLQVTREIAENKLGYLKGEKVRPISAPASSDPSTQSLQERLTQLEAKLTDLISDKLTAARISEQSPIRSIHVIDLASLPRQPSPKQPLTLMVMGLLGGLALGVSAATVREYAVQVVETEQDVAHATGLPVLGSIPVAERSESASGREVAPVDDLPMLFVAGNDLHSLPADACRAIRTVLDGPSLDKPLKTLLVTSPGAHEGKSTVLLNLGRAFLETDRHLLMIDADLRRPSLHRALRTPNEVGLADVLRDGTVWPEAFRALAPGMDFMPSGIRPANPSSLIASKHMVRVLELARERADVVLIDAPPVLAVAD